MNKYIKLVIAGLMVAGGIFLMFNRQVGWGIVCVVLSIVPIILFFKNEYILLSLWKMRDQKIDEVAKLLSNIKNYAQKPIWILSLYAGAYIC